MSKLILPDYYEFCFPAWVRYMGPNVRSPLGTVTRQFNSLLRTDRGTTRPGGTSRPAAVRGCGQPHRDCRRFVVRSEAAPRAAPRSENRDRGCLVSSPRRAAVSVLRLRRIVRQGRTLTAYRPVGNETTEHSRFTLLLPYRPSGGLGCRIHIGCERVVVADSPRTHSGFLHDME
jgi:hypothetical protein